MIVWALIASLDMFVKKFNVLSIEEEWKILAQSIC
jgi:hypothetical protein